MNLNREKRDMVWWKIGTQMAGKKGNEDVLDLDMLFKKQNKYPKSK